MDTNTCWQTTSYFIVMRKNSWSWLGHVYSLSLSKPNNITQGNWFLQGMEGVHVLIPKRAIFIGWSLDRKPADGQRFVDPGRRILASERALRLADTGRQAALIGRAPWGCRYRRNCRGSDAPDSRVPSLPTSSSDPLFPTCSLCGHRSSLRRVSSIPRFPVLAARWNGKKNRSSSEWLLFYEF